MTPPLKETDPVDSTTTMEDTTLAGIAAGRHTSNDLKGAVVMQLPMEPPPPSPQGTPKLVGALNENQKSARPTLKKKTSSLSMSAPDHRHTKSDDKVEQVCVDGNWAVSHAAYRMNDIAYIFPITPSSPMGETVDEWASEADPTKLKKNLWDQPLKVVELQSEGGAAGALHGALVSGSLATTFTASQGLLLYIPNLYKIAGELLPTVIHVASRALAGQALSIYGDHSDTMLLRGCGVSILSSYSVQEAHDLAIICQMATLHSRVPFIHFFDGFRTSHEINKINLVSDQQLRQLIPFDKVEEHRQRGLSPMHPSQRGTAQNPDVFMQLVESSNTYYNAVPEHVIKCMEIFYNIVGRQYKPYEYYYYGTTSPTQAIICMGSGVQVITGTLKYIQSEQTCCIAIRMFRPWNMNMFLNVLPSSVTRIAVLDRTREGGSQGEPLYLDVCTSLMQGGRGWHNILVAGGRYGLGSKDFTPRMVMAIIKNLSKKHTSDIQRPFTVGIDDDVTHLSLPLGKSINTLSNIPNITQCVFFGFGSDGTVGGNKQAIKIIGNYHTSMKVQAYFEYDAKKSSGWSVSHLRFANGIDIDAPYRIGDGQANYVACHNESYVQAHKFDVAKFLCKDGTFFLNTTIASLDGDPIQRMNALEELVSPKILRKLAIRNINFYIMDAGKLATQFGLTGKINMICMCVFFKLSGVLPQEDAISLLKASIRKTYGYKGDAIVKKNLDLLDAVVNNERNLIKVEIPNEWKLLNINSKKFLSRHIELISDEKTKKFMTDIVDPISKLEGDDIPVSKFLQNNLLGGVMIPGTSRYEKRNPNPSQKIPQWQLDSCTQCNLCVFVCPHAAIRPFILTKEQAADAPFAQHMKTLKAQGTELHGKRYALQISTLDCTGCNACVEVCPEQPKALKMGDLEDVLKQGGDEQWDYLINNIPNVAPKLIGEDAKYTLKGSQFQTPLMEFSGACSGCGETPYFKLLTQLFGERMVIANATGCSTIWGGSFPSNPYTINKQTGRGPAWANSLFEDNAEFGLGMFSSMKHRRERLIQLVQDYVHEMILMKQQKVINNIDEESKISNDDSSSNNTIIKEYQLVSLLQDWLDIRDDKSDKCTKLFDEMKPIMEELLESDEDKNSKLYRIWSDRDMFPKISQWIVGGDGWAYDIGYGGLDHIEAFESNDVNVLVVDTEMYSNTGGQQSKATPKGASVKFAMGGKQQTKKNIGEIFMTYEHVYVASIALAYPSQVLDAMIEADRHNGPSIIIAYAPCIQHSVTPNGLNDMIEESKYAVESGYWPLYRFNPELAKVGKNPFILDSKKLRHTVTQFLHRERRFVNLEKQNPQVAHKLFEQMNYDVIHRLDHLKQLGIGYKDFDHPNDAKVKVLFASETGNTAHMARDFAAACTLSHDADAMDDIDIDDIDGKHVIFFIATCGQGSMPQNGRQFYQDLLNKDEPFSLDTTFSIMGLGDSSYYFFCKAAKDVETRMLELGAKKLCDMGIGDDAADGGKDVGLHDWLDGIWPALNLNAPEEVPHIDPIQMTFSQQALLKSEEDLRVIRKYFTSDSIQAIEGTILSNTFMCSKEYNRDFRCIRIAKDTSKLNYVEGDCLEIFPQNDKERVAQFLHEYSSDYDERTVIKINQKDWGMEGDEISVGRLFENILDVFGPPTMHFMQQLATFELTNVERKEEMLSLDNLKSLSKKSAVTIADILLKYKNTAHPPLPALLSMIPIIKPRAYSIASAPEYNKSYIELCVLIDTFWCDEGMRYGLTCNMLRQKVEGNHLWCRIKCGSMDPPTSDQLVVCAGIGSGLAPHLSFLRARVAQANAGEDVAPFSLFFGNRKKSEEFLYQNELEEYAETYKEWFKLHTAFSRDQAHKIYVQDLVAQTDDARLLLADSTQDGMLYICGNRNLPKPMQDSLVKSFSKRSEDPEEIAQAKEIMEDMFIHGRAQQEVW